MYGPSMSTATKKNGGCLWGVLGHVPSMENAVDVLASVVGRPSAPPSGRSESRSALGPSQSMSVSRRSMSASTALDDCASLEVLADVVVDPRGVAAGDLVAAVGAAGVDPAAASDGAFDRLSDGSGSSSSSPSRSMLLRRTTGAAASVRAAEGLGDASRQAEHRVSGGRIRCDPWQGRTGTDRERNRLACDTIGRSRDRVRSTGATSSERSVDSAAPLKSCGVSACTQHQRWPRPKKSDQHKATGHPALFFSFHRFFFPLVRLSLSDHERAPYLFELHALHVGRGVVDPLRRFCKNSRHNDIADRLVRHGKPLCVGVSPALPLEHLS